VERNYAFADQPVQIVFDNFIYSVLREYSYRRVQQQQLRTKRKRITDFAPCSCLEWRLALLLTPHRKADHTQFAGAHPVLSLVSFNLGIALGEVIALALVFVVLGVLFKHVLGTYAGMIVLSLILGNVGWHWMTEGAHRLEHAISAGFPSASTVAWWVGWRSWSAPGRDSCRASSGARRSHLP
jgi:hypothetical protein